MKADLLEWVAYLRDIGVRDLHVAPRAATVRPSAPKVAHAPAPTVAPTPAPKVAPAPAPKIAPAPAAASVVLPGSDTADALRLVRADLGDCTRCRLHAGRTNLVFGVGNPNARLMFVGEGPGAEEDERGEPFVGRAGKKLNEMIGAMGLKREDVYIANVVKCRPPENRAPLEDEVATCSPYLFRQIEAIRPKVIVTLGSPAMQTLLGTKIGITKLRGTWQSFRGIPVMPTFHPAYLLRAYTMENRQAVWSDLKAALERITEQS